MALICVDVESDNQSPANGSMVCFGAVLVSDPTKTFYGRVKPIRDTWEPEALAISGFSREEHENFDDPLGVMVSFEKWLSEVSPNEKPVFISDNLAFDWSWISFYFWTYLNHNPFGYSGRRIGDLYCGIVKDGGKNFEWKKKFRKTKHDHNPVNDSLGNAEAIIAFKNKLGLKIKL